MQRLVHRVVLDTERLRDLADGLLADPASLEDLLIPRPELVHRSDQRAPPILGEKCIVRIRPVVGESERSLPVVVDTRQTRNLDAVPRVAQIVDRFVLTNQSLV